MSALTDLNAAISRLPPEVQIRVNVIAELLRGLLCNDVMQETEVAMQLVIVELEEDNEVLESIKADLKRTEH